ncbi:MAG: hypothetical protein DRN96_09665 [Thermoproteota archaeon]|nr:MAG: hypothetical protein DRN96_09665 [Candidatus Korarchaeota archaeon]
MLIVGSIFHKGDKLVVDERRGVFRKADAENLVNRAAEVAESVGMEFALDVIVPSAGAVPSYLGFAASTVGTVLLDPLSKEAALEGLRYASEIGLQSKLVYNSISLKTSREILEAMAEHRVKRAVLMAFSYDLALTSTGRVRAAEELLATTKGVVEEAWVDTAVLDIPSVGVALKAAKLLKEKHGVLVGCSPHNAVSGWRAARKLPLTVRRALSASLCALAASQGVDFVIVGPLHYVLITAPCMAAAMAAEAQVRLEEGEEVSEAHPRYKLPGISLESYKGLQL